MAAICMVAMGSVAFVHAQTPPEGLKEVGLTTSQFERAAPLPAWVEPQTQLPATQDKGPAVLLLADTQFNAAVPAFHVHRAWLANAADVLNELGRYSIEFDPAYQRLKLHTLRLVRAGTVIDKLATARISFLQRELGLERGVYSGQISASLLIDDVRVGDVFEVAYTIEGQNPVLNGKYVQSASWDQSLRTEYRRVSMLYPMSRNIAWKMFGDLNKQQDQPRESVRGDMRHLLWETRALAATEIETRVPSEFIPFRYIQFSEFQSWNEVGTWASDLFKAEGKLTPAAAELVAEFSRKPTSDERASAALSWVQNEIRYVSLVLGESSHRPAPANVTLERRYGDCKDKSALLIQLLQAMGIEARPVLVSARSFRGVSRSLPSPHVFDHAIVRAVVDGQVYFLDPTRRGQWGPLATMGQVWEDAEVLPVDPKASAFEIVSLPSPAARRRNELAEKITLPKFGGDAEVFVQHKYSGYEAETRRELFASIPASTLEKGSLENYERRYPGIQHVASPVVKDDRINNTLTLELRMKAPKMAPSVGPGWFLKYAASNFQGLIALPPSANRSQPYDMPSAGVNKYSVEVEFPPEVAKVTDPETRSVRDDAFEFTMTRSFRGNRAATSFELVLPGRPVEASRTSAFMAAVRKVYDLDRGVYVVERDEVKASGFLGLGAKTLQQMMESQLTDRIEKVSKGIDSGRLSGEDLAEAYCNRAEALSDLGKPAEGLKDAEKAVKTSPNFARAYACRGTINFAGGDFVKSIGDLSQAISLAPEEARTYYLRGHSRFYAGQFASAAEDFRKAGADAGGDQDLRLYAEMWRVWAQSRAGITPTPEQRQFAALNPQGEWPRPALAMLHGLLTPAEALAAVEKKNGDDRVMGLAEGYFYAGQWYRMQGDNARAAEYFRKTRGQGILLYTEHVAAAFELRQLEATK
ncbi:MAG: DUF3857 domain-containing protein [Ramlibacter sp.]|nr:DUF3857 domain-containing protein [Ramlibacter sp.]